MTGCQNIIHSSSLISSIFHLNIKSTSFIANLDKEYW